MYMVVRLSYAKCDGMRNMVVSSKPCMQLL